MSDKKNKITDELFNQLKLEMIEYCLGNSDVKLEQEIQYHINQYKKYNSRKKIIL